MIQFVDIDTGKTFNGDKPYIHWMGDCCSTNMIYNLPIFFISDKSELKIELKSQYFYLLDIEKIGEKIYINNFEYEDIKNLKTTELTSKGTLYDKDIYIHIIYILGSSDVEAEYIEDFIIDNNKYSVGLAVYDNIEANRINLSNFGINIPNSVQKCIYDTNVHEDKDDNIILNRKWKELLTNYWDTVANKGSYKSVSNSIKWFDWGKILEIKEFWKYKDPIKIHKDTLEDREITEFMYDKYKDLICRFSKTTYLGLYVPLQRITDKYDSQKNPILKDIVFKWSKIDIMLKLSLLGSFYETYFLPIHMDLIHTTVEDIVFTDLFKIINSIIWNREDYIYDAEHVSCNIKQNEKFRLENISVQVSQDTLFGSNYNDQIEHPTYDDVEIIGVNKLIQNLNDNELDIKNFWSQCYNGIGVVIPISIKIHTVNDFIKHSSIYVKKKKKDEDIWYNRHSYKLFKPDDNGDVYIDFNILYKNEGDKEIRMQFISSGGKIYTKNIKFKIIDNNIPVLKLFKIKHITRKLDISDLNGDWVNNYVMNRIRTENNIIQYIPIHANKYNSGIALNNILVYNKLIDKNEYRWVFNNYFVNYKIDDNYKYTICISKEFWFDPSPFIADEKKYIYRNDYGYFPEFHTLEEIEGDSLESYTIRDSDSVCIIPMIKTDNEDVLFEYGGDINNCDTKIKQFEWIFENVSTGEAIKINRSIKEPYITDNDKLLPNGYYNIIFKYKLGGEIKEIKLNSAVLKK